MKEIYKIGFMGLFYTTYCLLKTIFAVIFELLFIIVTILLIPFWWIKKVRYFLAHTSEIISDYICRILL